jgi:N-methylhydantoinase A
MALWLGVDTGGTFTDFVVLGGERVRIHKVLSTPAAPEQAILSGIAEMGLAPALANGELVIVHGTTVATNAALEQRGARTLFVTNAGLEDLLTIGRQTREYLYDLTPPPPTRPFAGAPALGVAGRLDSRGAVIEPLTDAAVDDLVARVRAADADAVAICLLHACLDPAHEQRLRDALADAAGFVCCSSDVLPVAGEYERGVATWLNAWLGPVVADYLARLDQAVAGAPLSVMQSHGGTVAAASAARTAVSLLLSGPAGGLRAAQVIGDAIGEPRLLTFDMGGTSTDVALVDGDVRLTLEGRFAGMPVAVPMVDMHTIGAGGGSLARVDDAGLLHVGPRSAGADPGPACYGRGGTGVTVTDANLWLGRLQPSFALGGNLSLDSDAAESALAGLASALDSDVTDAARGVVALANEHMVQALRVISIQKGHDPADFALMCFGGAGGLHVCDLADALGMHRAVVPVHGGVLSALGLLWAPRQRELVQAVPPDAGATGEIVRRLEQQGRQALRDEGLADTAIHVSTSADLRYAGQSFTLNVPLQVAHTEAAEQAFHDEHERQYGHRLDMPVEWVNLRVRCQGQVHPPGLPALAASDEPAVGEYVRVDGVGDPVPVYPRSALGPGAQIAGPALVVEPVATTWIAPQWCAQVHAEGHLLLFRR